MTKRTLAAALLPAALWIGCGEDIPVSKPVAAPVAKAPAAAEDAIAGAPVEEYFYNPAGKRDPFKPFYTKNPSGTGNPIDPNSPPLQRWDVDKFLLSGVIWNTNIPRALLVDPEGIGHVIQVGTYVGRNWGKVTSISDDAVVVTEEYQTIDGELVVNPVTVHFPGKDTKK